MPDPKAATLSSEELESRLTCACDSLLKEAIRISTDMFGSSGLPIVSVTALVLEATGSGRHSGKKIEFSELDTPLIFTRMGVSVESSKAWEAAKEAIQRYIDEKKIKPSSFWLHEIADHYLWPLVLNYLREQNSFDYTPQRAEECIKRLLQHLGSENIEVFGLIAMEGFAAEKVFDLAPNFRFRPINQRELQLLGRLDYLLPPGRYRGPNPLFENFPFPHTDWWIGEVTLQNPRGTADGFNKMHNLAELLASAFRVYKEGNCSLGLALQGLCGDFGRSGFRFNPNLQRLGTGEMPYRLSDKEVTGFVGFWEKFRRIMEADKHYIQIPVRRLRTASTRAEREDALVDYVIGLESLLGADDERTELSYRFRVRGAVVLSKEKNERRRYLRDLRSLYDLRSRIVHGGTVSNNEVEKFLPTAEDFLRRIWMWYFDNWTDEVNNKAALAWIDEELVGK